MLEQLKPKTAANNGRLWSMRARDWADLQERVVQPAFAAVLDRTGVKSGTRYLDVGCGSGMAASMAAARGATVSGIDASEALLAIARERVPDGAFRQGDMEELPYADHAFDVVTGFNAFQYAGNPAVALREARRVTKPDGVVAVVTWGQPEGMDAVAVIGALKPLLPPPPPGAPGPFALSDETALRQFAAEAGLRPLQLFDVDSPFTYPDEQIALRALGSSGVAAKAMEHSGEAAVHAAHSQALAQFRRPDGSYRIGASFRCLPARP